MQKSKNIGWKRRDDAVSDMEEKNIRGKGLKSSSEQLRDIGYNSVYEKAWLAAADYIDELNDEIMRLKNE